MAMQKPSRSRRQAKGREDKGKARQGQGKARARARARSPRKSEAVVDCSASRPTPERASSIRLAKGWGGRAGSAIAVYLSMSASVPFPDALRRGLLAGAAGYIVGYGGTASRSGAR